MRVITYSQSEMHSAKDTHGNIGMRIRTALEDLNEDCDIILEFDDAEGPFSYLFSGTSLSLEFHNDSIQVLQFNFEKEDDEVIQEFESNEIERAVEWLLTQVK